MDIETLKAMLERRGYNRETVTTDWRKRQIGHVLYAMEHDWKTQLSFASDARASIDECLGDWQHHVWCKQCHEPLLVLNLFNSAIALKLLQTGTKPLMMLVDGKPEPDPSIMQDATKRATYTEYRSAKAGPVLPMLEQCPKCGQRLEDGTEEIKDDVNAL